MQNNFTKILEFSFEAVTKINSTSDSIIPNVTECFQQIVFILTPCLLFCVIGFINLWVKWKKKTVAIAFPWTLLCILKMVLCGLLILLSLSELSLSVYYNSKLDCVPQIEIYAAIAKLMTYVVILCILWQNKKQQLRSSTLLSIFWFIYLLCCALRYRSILLRIFDKDLYLMFSDKDVTTLIELPLVLCQFIFCLFNDPASHDEKSVIEESPFFSLITFSWCYKYIIKSMKKRLTIPDFQPLYVTYKADVLWKNFGYNWSKQTTTGNKLRDPFFVMLFTLVKSAWPYVVLTCIFQLFFDFAIFLPAVVLDKFLTWVAENDPDLWKGRFYCFAFILSQILCVLAFNGYMYYGSSFAHQIRALITSAVFQKALKLSVAAKRKYTSGEIINLISVDAQNIFESSYDISFFFGAPLKLFLSFALLWYYLGISSLAGLLIMLIMVILGFIVSSKTEKVQEKQMKMKDSRIKMMTEILNGIKVLKLYTWEIPFMNNINEIRNKEISLIKKFQLLLAAAIMVWHCCPLFIGVANFVTYLLIDERHVLTAALIFASLNILNTLQHTVYEIPQIIAKFIQTKVSLRRVAEFLLAEECDQYAISSEPDINNAISIQNGTFSWFPSDHGDTEFMLRNIQFHVKKGSLVAVIGPVGCGKSSLLSAILGDMYKKNGSINVQGSISFVPQQAWILNQTLRQNILMVNKMDKAKYNKVIEECCLIPDLNMLVAGDRTEIGEKGINLSGGQKQRVSLARAVIHEADIYLFDDPLSAVDAHVGKHLFDHVISHKGLLKNKTRILVTHNVNILPEVDVVITMRNGEIQAIGSYNDLFEKDKEFANFINEHLNVITSKKKECIINEESSEIEKSVENNLMFRQLSNDSNAEVSKLIEDEGMEIGQVKASVYMSYFKHLGIFYLLGIVIGCAVSTVFETGVDVWLSHWTEDARLENGAQDIDQRNFRITVYSLLGFGKTITKVVSVVCLAYASAKASRLYHNKMLDAIMKSPMSFFDTTPLGRISNRFANDMNDIDTSISMFFEAFTGCIIYAAVSLSLIGYNVPIFFAFLIPILVIFYIIQKCYLTLSRQLRRLISTTRSPIYSHLNESINGSLSIKAYNIEDHFIKICNRNIDNNTLCSLHFSFLNRWLDLTMQVFGCLIILVITLTAVESKDTLGAGAVGLITIYSLSLMDTLSWIIFSGSQFQMKLVSVERVNEYTKLPPEAPWEGSNELTSWPSKGQLEFKNYSTRYREGLDLVISNVNLHVNENEKVGIVGRTGAGKSSITMALFRIIEPAVGTIFIDNVDVSKIGLHQLRSKLTIIPQDPTLFMGSFRMNLDPSNVYTDDELWTSLRCAHLKEFVSSLPEGLEFEIAEGGANLSVGQRQLVCLARALLKNAKILILDEATAAVDMETDQLIQNTIRSEFKNYTVITIAHRLNTIMDYDKIVVMDAGQIVEIGAPSDLLKNTCSQFYNMAKDAGLI